MSDFTPRSTKPKNQGREALIEEIARIVDADPTILEGVEKLLPQDAKHITININIGQVTQQISQIAISTGRDDMPRGRSSNDVLYLMVVASLILGVAFIVGGVWLVYLGGTGTTTFALFGNSFNSQNVGVASIFCGAVVAALTFRRVVKGLERLGGK